MSTTAQLGTSISIGIMGENETNTTSDKDAEVMKMVIIYIVIALAVMAGLAITAVRFFGKKSGAISIEESTRPGLFGFTTENLNRSGERHITQTQAERPFEAASFRSSQRHLRSHPQSSNYLPQTNSPTAAWHQTFPENLQDAESEPESDLEFGFDFDFDFKEPSPNNETPV